MKLNRCLKRLCFCCLCFGWIIKASCNPFFNQYQTCDEIKIQIDNELKPCQWIGTLSALDSIPILNCQNELHLLTEKDESLNDLFYASFKIILTEEKLTLQFQLPNYCHDVKDYHLYKN